MTARPVTLKPWPCLYTEGQQLWQALRQRSRLPLHHERDARAQQPDLPALPPSILQAAYGSAQSRADGIAQLLTSSRSC